MTPTEPLAWYATADADPPHGVRVLVIWDGRVPFEAAIVRDPGSKRLCWLTHDRGRPVFLPTDTAPADPKRPWAGWHTLEADWPDFWRPVNPAAWKAPLPAPAYVEPAACEAHSKPRMWSARQSFQAVDDAEASDLAREMEQTRGAAGSRYGEPVAGTAECEPPERQWWLDPHQVTYSAPGAITPREVEGRVMRALKTERWVRVDWPTAKTFGGVLAKMAKTIPLTPEELALQDPIDSEDEPTGRDWDDFLLVTTGWLKALTHGGKRFHKAEGVLRLRSRTPALSWRRIAALDGRSHETVRQLFQQAIEELTRAANGEATLGSSRAQELLETVQAGNLAARRARGGET